jgi:hypothetical protein
MKLYNVVFTEPQTFAAVRLAAKEGDSRAIVTINEGSEGKSFELQSERAAVAVAAKLGGVVKIIEYDITKLHRD